MADLYCSSRTMCVRATIPARPHEIEVSEGVSIFCKEKKNQYTSPYRIKDGQISFKVSFVREGK